MNGHADLWIDAYKDGELSNGRKRQVEKHLGGCQRCQALLEQHRSLSILLQEVPPASGQKPAEQFIAEVKLRLPRRSMPGYRATNFTQPVFSLAWQLIPVVLLLAWAFIQTVSLLSEVEQLTPGAESAMQQALSPLAGLLGISAGALGNLGQESLTWLGFFNILDWNWFTNLAVLFCIGLLYVGWLASWWVRTQSAAVPQSAEKCRL
jgi:anti-sigma factor RsiW